MFSLKSIKKHTYDVSEKVFKVTFLLVPNHIKQLKKNIFLSLVEKRLQNFNLEIPKLRFL